MTDVARGTEAAPRRPVTPGDAATGRGDGAVPTAAARSWRGRGLPPAPGLAAESGLLVMANPYQQLKREVAGVLGEPVAWVCRGRTTRHPVLRLVPWRSAPVLLALTPTHVAVFLRTGAALPLATPSCERVPLSRVRAVGLRHVRAVDARGRVHWFRLDAREPTARGFLTAPRTFRVR